MDIIESTFQSYKPPSDDLTWKKLFDDMITKKVDYYTKAWQETVGSKVAVKSRIRVTFNRPLTYSEREQFRVDLEETVYLSGKFDQPNRLYVEDTDSDDSRALFYGVAEYVEKNFVNVHPVAVYTEIPRVKV